MKRLLMFFPLLLIAAVASGEEKQATKYQPTDEFVQYLKDAANPSGFGLRSDGRFYPYSTRYGRRIGYGQVIPDKSLYVKGWTKEDAEKQLRAEIDRCADQLRDLLTRKDPAHPFDSLGRPGQEILIDFAVYQGVDRIPDRVISLVIAKDWKQFINDYVYIRGADGWPDVLRNYTFGQRWIYGKTPLVEMP